jgi:hypothetical protein
MLSRAAARIGQSLEVEVFCHGSKDVNFLSRFFSEDVWNGDPTTTCSMTRALSKLHVTTNLGEFTALQKLSQKLSGLAKTDRHTPILKQMIDAAERVGLDLHVEIDRRLAGWWHQYEEEVNWPNRAIEDEEEFLGRWFHVCDTAALYQALTDAKQAEDLLKLPAICGVDDTPVKAHPRNDVVVNDTLLSTSAQQAPAVPTTPVASAAPVNDNSKQGFTVVAAKHTGKFCMAYVKGTCKDNPCRFPHVVGCREWLMKSTCVRGAKCRFAHLDKPKITK